MTSTCGDDPVSIRPRGIGRRKNSLVPPVGERRRISIGSLAAIDCKENDQIVESAKNYKVNYMCRAVSFDNKDGSHENEDRFFCEEHVVEPSGEVDMFIIGVMDGHDGTLAAEVVSEHFPPAVIHNCFKRKQSVHTAHVEGFQKCEDIMKQTESSAGCCVNSCVVWGRLLWCANLGDCRAVYIPLNHHEHGNAHFELGKFCWLSRDFRASKPYEMTRIRSKGYNEPASGGRIAGCLEPTRTIGDLDLKAQLPDDVITITPETRFIDIKDKHDAIITPRVMSPGCGENLCQGLLIQGTDGLWDGLTGDEIMACFNQNVEAIRTLQKYLDESVRDGSFNPECGPMIDELERLAQSIAQISTSKEDCHDDTTMVLTVLSLSW